MKRYTEVEVSERKSDSYSSAPNGSVVNVHDFYTTVVSRQDWHDTPENGVYAGRSYKITDVYISNRPDTRGQLIRSSSQPWKDEA